MKKLQRLLQLDDSDFASFIAGLVGGFTLVTGLYLFHQWGVLG